MKSVKLLPALLALSISFPLLAQEAASDGAVVLRPEFFPGKIYNYVTETTVKMQLPARQGEAAPAERQVAMELHARLKVDARSDGAAGVSVLASTDQLKMDISAGAKTLRYDSKNPEVSEANEAKVLARHFDGATKRTITLDLDESGTVVKAVEQGGGGTATPLPGLPQFGPDELKQLVAGMVQGFSPDPVKVGDEWVQKGKRKLEQFGEVDLEMTYRYAGDETFEGADCARIEYTGRIKGDVSVNGSVPGSTGGKLGFEGTELTGKLMFDKLRKAVRLSEQDVKISVDAPAQGSPSGTVRLPMHQNIKTRLVALQDS